MTDYKTMIDARLRDFFVQPEDEPLHGYADAIRYSLLSGGKRIRGSLLLEFCRICGGDPETALDAACGLEMLHTYSLIHDDLPCMDDDNLRRGRPTNHVVYGECTAVLAGDALQAEAFTAVLHSRLDDVAKVRCARLLADAAGFAGMCGGQYLDMLGEGKTLSAGELDAINARKTGALLSAACAMGVAAAGGAERQEENAGRFGALIGLAFQIRDDMLDVLSTEAELGKPIGSDRDEGKNTYMALLGEEGCANLIRKLTEEGIRVLREHFSDTAELEAMAAGLAGRNS